MRLHELRTHPDKNPRQYIADHLLKYKDRDDVFVSFTSDVGDASSPKKINSDHYIVVDIKVNDKKIKTKIYPIKDRVLSLGTFIKYFLTDGEYYALDDTVKNNICFEPVDYNSFKSLSDTEKLNYVGIAEQRFDKIKENFKINRNTSGSKLGLNPKSSYNTPIGIYCYPIKHIIKKIYDSGEVTAEFTGENRWQFLYIVEQETEKVLTKDMTEVEYRSKVEKLFERFELSDDLLEEWESEAHDSSYFGKFWNVTRMVANKYADDAGSKPSVYWTALMKTLGYDGAVDNGSGIIHGNEPTQAVFFGIKYLKTLDVIKNESTYNNFANTVLGGKNKNKKIKMNNKMSIPFAIKLLNDYSSILDEDSLVEYINGVTDETERNLLMMKAINYRTIKTIFSKLHFDKKFFVEVLKGGRLDDDSMKRLFEIAEYNNILSLCDLPSFVNISPSFVKTIIEGDSIDLELATKIAEEYTPKDNKMSDNLECSLFKLPCINEEFIGKFIYKFPCAVLANYNCAKLLTKAQIFKVIYDAEDYFRSHYWKTRIADLLEKSGKEWTTEDKLRIYNMCKYTINELNLSEEAILKLMVTDDKVHHNNVFEHYRRFSDNLCRRFLEAEKWTPIAIDHILYMIKLKKVDPKFVHELLDGSIKHGCFIVWDNLDEGTINKLLQTDSFVQESIDKGILPVRQFYPLVKMMLIRNPKVYAKKIYFPHIIFDRNDKSFLNYFVNDFFQKYGTIAAFDEIFRSDEFVFDLLLDAITKHPEKYNLDNDRMKKIIANRNFNKELEQYDQP